MNITTLRLFSGLITILGQSLVYAHGGAATDVRLLEAEDLARTEVDMT